MTTFEQVVEKVKQFSPEQRKMLTHLIKKWEIEAVRHEIARDAKDSLQQFRQGDLRPQSAQSVIRELRNFAFERTNSDLVKNLSISVCVQCKINTISQKWTI